MPNYNGTGNANIPAGSAGFSVGDWLKQQGNNASGWVNENPEQLNATLIALLKSMGAFTDEQGRGQLNSIAGPVENLNQSILAAKNAAYEQAKTGAVESANANTLVGQPTQPVAGEYDPFNPAEDDVPTADIFGLTDDTETIVKKKLPDGKFVTTSTRKKTSGAEPPRNTGQRITVGDLFGSSPGP